MEDEHAPKLKRYLPHVVVATLAVVVLPLTLVSMLQASGHLRSPLMSVALTVALSIGMATAGSAYWTRRAGSRDLVFGDLMLWGWLRRVRTERRLTKTTRLLGAESLRARATGLNASRQARLLQQLASALEARDPYTHGHSRRVTRHSHMIAKEMGLSRGQVAKVRAAAAMHDVGKINTPRAILNKPGSLTEEEFAVIKHHPAEGAEMVSEMKDSEITAMVRHHHERLDGAGYPDGLVGAEIPLGARIIAVADSFDAITSSRPYRSATDHRKAIEILTGEAGLQLDPLAVRAFLSYYRGRKPVALFTLFTAIPERLFGWVGGAFWSAGVAPIAKSVFAVGTGVLIGGSLASFATVREAHPDGRMSSPVAEAAVGVAGRTGTGALLRADGQTGDRPQQGSASRHAPAARRGSKPRARAARRSRSGASASQSSGIGAPGPVAASSVPSQAPPSTQPVGTGSVDDGSPKETSDGGPAQKKKKKQTGAGHEKKKDKNGSQERKRNDGAGHGKSGSGHEKAGAPGQPGSPGRGRSGPARRSSAPSPRSSDLASEPGGTAFAQPGGSDLAAGSWDTGTTGPDLAAAFWDAGTIGSDLAAAFWDTGTAEPGLAGGFWGPGTAEPGLAGGSWDPGTAEPDPAGGFGGSDLVPEAGAPGQDGQDFASEPGAPAPPSR